MRISLKTNYRCFGTGSLALWACLALAFSSNVFAQSVVNDWDGEKPTSSSLEISRNTSSTSLPLGELSAGQLGNPPLLHCDVSAGGMALNPGVRGLALSDEHTQGNGYKVGVRDAVELSDGGSLRGVAGGLFADYYDWRTRNNEAGRPTTLEFLRFARDHKANLFITANTRGLVEWDPVNPGKRRHTTTDTQTLARIAAQWVRYVNHIVPTYRQGEVVSDPGDRAILNSLKWSSAAPGDSFSTLLAAGETSVPRVVYWEIGNEPTVSLGGGIGITDGRSLSAREYYERYKAITGAMLAVDPTIKVGPCIVNGDREREHLNALLSDPQVRVDFISYHPYQRMGDLEEPARISSYLAKVWANHYGRWKTVRDLVTSNGRSLDSVELAATEYNVSYWKYNQTEKEGQMAHMLGTVETIFSYARLGLTAAHYWIWASHVGEGTRFPVTKAFEGLRDYMGDRLLACASFDKLTRVYVTRDSVRGHVAVWALNFSDAKDTTVTVALDHLAGKPGVKLRRLACLSGKTTLSSANLASVHKEGPRHDVDWIEEKQSAADLRHCQFVARAAELTLVVVEPEGK